MNLVFTPTDEYVLQNEIIIVDPTHFLEKDTWKNVIDYLGSESDSTLIADSGLLAIDSSEFFCFQWEEGTYEVDLDNKFIGEVECNSGHLCIIRKDNFVKLSNDINMGVFVNVKEKDIIQYFSSEEIRGIIDIKSAYDAKDEYEEEDIKEDLWDEE